jgi:hypothetical protein
MPHKPQRVPWVRLSGLVSWVARYTNERMGGGTLRAGASHPKARQHAGQQRLVRLRLPPWRKPRDVQHVRPPLAAGARHADVPVQLLRRSRGCKRCRTCECGWPHRRQR